MKPLAPVSSTFFIRSVHSLPSVARRAATGIPPGAPTGCPTCNSKSPRLDLTLRVLACGAAAGSLSAAVLAWRGRVETGSPAAPVNAVSHWFWGREALGRDDATLDHTAAGAAVHYLSALFWAVGSARCAPHAGGRTMPTPPSTRPR